MSAPDFGTRWRTPFAFFAPRLSSWRTSPESSPRWEAVQTSLLSEPSSLIWPRQGTWDAGCAYEQPTSELLTAEIVSSSLLPTPVAHDDGKTPEAHRAMKARLKGGPRTKITSLAVLARADFEQPDEPLLPTPQAWDGDRGPDYARQETRSETHGSGGDDLTTTVAKMLPTPQARDFKGRNQRDDPSCLPGALHLLPTPMANPDNPGAGGELRAAVTHGPGRRNRTGVDSWGRPNRGRLLPTPTANDSEAAGSRNLEGSKAHAGISLTDAVRFGDSETPRLLPTPTTGESKTGHGRRGQTSKPGPQSNRDLDALASNGAFTEQPSPDGNESSDDPLPGQLTIADAFSPSSWNGCSASPPDGPTSKASPDPADSECSETQSKSKSQSSSGDC